MRTHFMHFDPRFCGERDAPRRVTSDPNEVTCSDCKRRDQLVLSAQGRSYVESLEKGITQ